MPKTKKLTPEQEAEMLFDLYHTEDGKVGYEIGYVLDDYINAASSVYNEKRFFVPMYLDARTEDEGKAVRAILREIQKGTTPEEIASKLAMSKCQPTQKTNQRKHLAAGVYEINKRGVIEACNPANDDTDPQPFIGMNFFTELAICKKAREFRKDYAEWLVGGSVRGFNFPRGCLTFLPLNSTLALVLVKKKSSLRTAKRVEKDLTSLEPKFSIYQGRLIITM
jgi:hypothetical protein